MEKSDKSIHNISIAAIKRATIKPYDFRWTRFYEESAGFQEAYPALDIMRVPEELMICSVVIDADNYSVLTTRQMITREDGELTIIGIRGAINKGYGDFKSRLNVPFTMGIVLLPDGTACRYFIETGRAAMVMIYGVMTVV